MQRIGSSHTIKSSVFIKNKTWLWLTGHIWLLFQSFIKTRHSVPYEIKSVDLLSYSRKFIGVRNSCVYLFSQYTSFVLQQIKIFEHVEHNTLAVHQLIKLEILLQY